MGEVDAKVQSNGHHRPAAQIGHTMPAFLYPCAKIKHKITQIKIIYRFAFVQPVHWLTIKRRKEGNQPIEVVQLLEDVHDFEYA